MKYDFIIYEAGVLILGAALVAIAMVIYKLTKIVKENKKIWVMPALAALVLLVSFGTHVYASFSLMPKMDQSILKMSSPEVIMDAQKLDAAKVQIKDLRSSLMILRAVSFSCFFIAALLLLAATTIYLRWISK